MADLFAERAVTLRKQDNQEKTADYSIADYPCELIFSDKREEVVLSKNCSIPVLLELHPEERRTLFFTGLDLPNQPGRGHGQHLFPGHFFISQEDTDLKTVGWYKGRPTGSQEVTSNDLNPYRSVDGNATVAVTPISIESVDGVTSEEVDLPAFEIKPTEMLSTSKEQYGLPIVIGREEVEKTTVKECGDCFPERECSMCDLEGKTKQLRIKIEQPMGQADKSSQQ